MISSSATVLPHPAAVRGQERLITIASGKGGVGKTWFAVTLTHALARAGTQALLFDGDLGLANVDIQLGLMPAHDIGNVIDGDVTLDDAIQKYAEGGFDIIAGRSGSGALAGLERPRLTQLRGQLVGLTDRYDRVVVDLGAGVETAVRILGNSGGIVLTVTTDEPTSLTDAYAFIKVMNSQTPDADIRVVVNMANDQREGERTYATIRKACESFLKISPPLAGIVRADPRVRDTIRHQAPMLKRHPTSPAASDVEAICERLGER
jgi:flagellar biosynthesis protein FlhG